ncbi:S-adenosyl-L-methionine-dependent methyltransferase [Mycena capillaripes]|nr:S-adenosyl-L-methionine-dependent methyltransferase [Mycena capillaripes]
MSRVEETLTSKNWSSDSLKSHALSIDHVTREYQAYPGSQYSLPTDDLERQRKVSDFSKMLLLQHKTLKALFGNRIVLAPVDLGATDKVLDIGTGPGRLFVKLSTFFILNPIRLGLWILDLAESVDPSVIMLAVDIESRLFPPSPPKNVHFRVESVTNLPSDWTDTFSLVHQRLLMIALQVPEWPVALHEIHRVLRPGGWVQLAEGTAWPAGKYPGKPCMEKLIAMYHCLVRSRNLYINCADDMPAMLEDAGFVDIHRESRMKHIGKWAGTTGVSNKVNHVAVLRGIKTPILNAGGYGYVSSEAEYDALLEGLEKEWDEVPGTEKEFIIFWAKKPAI